jgi:hypothetical protein
VYRGDLDDVVGVVTLQNLIDASGRVADRVRPALALPESMGVPEALRRLQAQRQQMAIVVNEYGGTEGIVTVEDLLEELVGEIYDELDPDSRAIHRQPDGSLLRPGSFPILTCPILASLCRTGRTRPWLAWSLTASAACPRRARPSRSTAGSWKSSPSNATPSPGCASPPSGDNNGLPAERRTQPE